MSPLQKKKKSKLCRLPKVEDSMEGWNSSPFGPIYIGEEGRTLGKTYGIKARCYWEHPWEMHWEAYIPTCSPSFKCF